MYVSKKDTVSAIRIASEGAKAFPNNASLARQEIELSLMNGKEKEVIAKIEAQAAKEPDNKTYPFYLGIAYNAIKDEQKAEEAYKRALAIDPNYGDAALNLGVIIMNRGIDLNNKAANMPANKQQEYNALIKKSSAEIDKAFPYLEKAVAVDPKSRLALDNLRVYYVLKKNEAKAAEYKKKVDALR
jgi:tetratricopeptide (TPR) repeat protein